MSAGSHQRLFTLWFGIGFPLALAGGLMIAFATDALLGWATAAAYTAWMAQSVRTTCARCPFYATSKCGLPGMIAPYLVSHRPAATLSHAAIRRHHRFDRLMLAAGIGLYCLEPMLLPAMLVWSAGVVLISFGPQRYHGLLHRLRRPEADPAPARPLIALPVVISPTESGGSCPPLANQVAV